MCYIVCNACIHINYEICHEFILFWNSFHLTSYTSNIIWRNCYHLANLHSGHVGRTQAAIAYIVYIGKINLNQIVVLCMYKHKKPASQFILHVSIDQIGPNLVSMIRNSEFHLQTKFWSEAGYSSDCNGCKICEKCRILRIWLQKNIGYSMWINKARI